MTETLSTTSALPEDQARRIHTDASARLKQVRDSLETNDAATPGALIPIRSQLDSMIKTLEQRHATLTASTAPGDAERAALVLTTIGDLQTLRAEIEEVIKQGQSRNVVLNTARPVLGMLTGFTGYLAPITTLFTHGYAVVHDYFIEQIAAPLRRMNSGAREGLASMLERMGASGMAGFVRGTPSGPHGQAVEAQRLTVRTAANQIQALLASASIDIAINVDGLDMSALNALQSKITALQTILPPPIPPVTADQQTALLGFLTRVKTALPTGALTLEQITETARTVRLAPPGPEAVPTVTPAIGGDTLTMGATFNETYTVTPATATVRLGTTNLANVGDTATVGQIRATRLAGGQLRVERLATGTFAATTLTLGGRTINLAAEAPATVLSPDIAGNTLEVGGTFTATNYTFTPADALTFVGTTALTNTGEVTESKLKVSRPSNGNLRIERAPGALTTAATATLRIGSRTITISLPTSA